MSNANTNPDEIRVSRSTAERGFFVAVLAAVLGYYNIAVVDNDKPQSDDVVVVDVDKDFVKTAAQAINDLHADNVTIKLRLSHVEKQLGLPPISPIAPKPGASGSIESKGSNKGAQPIGEVAPMGTKPKS